MDLLIAPEIGAESSQRMRVPSFFGRVECDSMFCEHEHSHLADTTLFNVTCDAEGVNICADRLATIYELGGCLCLNCEDWHPLGDLVLMGLTQGPLF